jgi:hypothetical protein
MRKIVLAALCCFASAAQAEDNWSSDPAFQKCPGAAAFYRQLENKADREQPKLAAPTLPKLRDELLKMAKADQDARNTVMQAGAMDESTWAPVAKVDGRNLPRIKAIVKRNGFPTASQIGLDGVNAAWLLVQHADADPAFQARVLKMIEKRGRDDGIQPDAIALLTDRVLRAQGKPQIYGSQFEQKDGRYVPQPIDDPDHVDERRAKVELMPMADYSCLLNAQNGK